MNIGIPQATPGSTTLHKVALGLLYLCQLYHLLPVAELFSETLFEQLRYYPLATLSIMGSVVLSCFTIYRLISKRSSTSLLRRLLCLQLGIQLVYSAEPLLHNNGSNRFFDWVLGGPSWSPLWNSLYTVAGIYLLLFFHKAVKAQGKTVAV